jgi:hypothetical protein
MPADVNMLARKISRAKWLPKEYLAAHDISADAISGGCLRTERDALSCWRCAPNRQDVAEIGLAVGCTLRIIETIDIVLLPQEELAAIGVEMKRSEGETPVQDLRSRHVDLVHLGLDRFAAIARMLAPRVRSDSVFIFRFTKKELTGLILTAIAAKRVSKADLHQDLQKALDRAAM